MDSYLRWMQVCGAVTMTGCPALAAPAGFDAQGRSMGIQIVGKPRREIDCLKIANAYDSATHWPANARRRWPSFSWRAPAVLSKAKSRRGARLEKLVPCERSERVGFGATGVAGQIGVALRCR